MAITQTVFLPANINHGSPFFKSCLFIQNAKKTNIGGLQILIIFKMGNVTKSIRGIYGNYQEYFIAALKQISRFYESETENHRFPISLIFFQNNEQYSHSEKRSQPG